MTRRRRQSGAHLPIAHVGAVVDPLDHPVDTLRALIGASSSPIFSVDHEYRYTSFNPAHAQAMKTIRAIDIALGGSVVAGGSAAGDTVTKASLDRALRGESFVERAPSGGDSGGGGCSETAHDPIREADATVVGVVVQVREHPGAATIEALAESEARYRSYVDNAPYGVFITDEIGRYVEVNKAAAELTGYSPEELTAMGIADVLASDSLDSGLRQFARLSTTGSSSGTATLIRKDGTGFQVRIDAVRLSATRFLGFIVDVSEQERAEAEIAAIAEQLRSTLAATVSALGATTELRDPYTAGHQRRVTELAVAIGAGLGWDEARVKTLETAALLHDVGKLVVPAEILTKPGRLSETEMQFIRQHAAASAALIAGIEFGGPVAATVVQHHERLDGSGYPAGLAGAHILPEARVLAVADVVEAMLSHRPYRAALPLDAAMAEVEQGAGVRYDAEVCAVCLRLFREQGFTLSLLSGQ